MDCRDARESLSDFRDGSLTETASREISIHLVECDECSEVDRSLQAVRERLRNLPPVSAPPELLARIRETVAREGGPSSPSTGDLPAEPPARTVFSRLKVPLEAAAAVLLCASTYWYWAGSRPATVPVPAPAPVEIASSASPPASPPAATPAPVRIARAAPRPAAAPSPRDRNEADRESPGRSIATLPEDTPDPKIRVWSLSDLPAAPVLRASTRFGRVVPVPPPAGDAASPQTEPILSVAQSSRLNPPIPYGRDVSLNVEDEEREEAGERIGETARRLGGSVEGTDRVVPDGTVAVRVLLPERTAPAFLDELERIGKIPPEGRPQRSVLPAGPAPGTVAYTVRLRSH